MRKLVYYVGVSLDGYIAGPGDEVDFCPLSDPMAAWINAHYPETVPTHLRAGAGIVDTPNGAFDTVIMGRRTYEPALAAGLTSPYAHLRQIVVSSTLGNDGAALDPAVEVVSDDPIAAVRDLKAEDGLDIWLAGGGRLAAALLPEVDELIVKQYPVVAGAGLPAFAGAFRPTAFAPTRSENFDNGARVTWFERAARS